MIISMQKWLKRGSFSAPSLYVPVGSPPFTHGLPGALQETPFVSTFPMFAPSLSW